MSELKDEDLTIELSFNKLKESILKHYAKGEYKQSSIIILRDIFRVAQQANEASTNHDKALDIDIVSESFSIQEMIDFASGISGKKLKESDVRLFRDAR